MNFVHCLGAILIYGRNISQAIFKINTLVCNLPLPQKKKKKKTLYVWRMVIIFYQQVGVKGSIHISTSTNCVIRGEVSQYAQYMFMQEQYEIAMRKSLPW